MNRSRFLPPAVFRRSLPIGLAGLLALSAPGAFAQSDESGFPRQEVEKQNAPATTPAAPGSAPAAPAMALPKETQTRALTYKGARHPPTELNRLADGHYTPYAPPAIPKEGPQPYIIKSGDNLWNLAQASFGSPLYWPLIWEKNEYITDAHWIYPGDPLWMPGANVVPIGKPENHTTADTDEDASRYLLPLQGLPPIYENDMYCSGYIDPEFNAPPIRILTHTEEARDYQAEGYFAFLNEGKNQGLAAGQEYAIIRPGSIVRHPKTNVDLGLLVQRVGRGKITILADDTSVFEITRSCEAIHRGDYLVPFEARPAPFDVSRRGDYPIYIPANGKTLATVVLLDHTSSYNAEHDIVYLNVGSKSEIAAGDKFMIYRNSRYDTLMAIHDTMRDSSFTAGFTDRDLMTARAGEALQEDELGRDNPALPHRADANSGALTAEATASHARLPRKTIAELVVLDTTATTATCRVIHSETELQVGDIAELQ